MKRTVRIITTVAAIALTIAIMCVGIFAAKKVTLTSNVSKISFTATDVSASVTATKQLGADPAQDLIVGDASSVNGEFTPAFEHGKDYSDTITVGDINFTDVDSTFTLTITVTNTFTAEVGVNAAYTVTCANTNGYLAVETTVDGSAYTDGTAKTLAKGATATFVTTIQIAEAQKDAVLQSGFTNETFNFKLELTRA